MRWMFVLAEPGQAPPPPWDSEAAVKAHITDVLPGTTFDAQGVGRFIRRTYTIEFHLSHGDPGVMEVAATDAAATSAVLRVAQKAGWRVLDFDTGAPVALPGEPAAPAATASRPPAASDTGARWKIVGALAGALALAVVGGVRFVTRVEPPPPRIVVDTPPPAGAVPVAGADDAPSAPADEGGGLLDFRLRDKDGKLISQEAAGEMVERIRGEIDGARATLNRRARVLPRYRDHVAVQQILGYLAVSQHVQERFASRHWISPTVLASPLRTSSGTVVAAPLPATYRADVRDGYRYTFQGLGCSWEAYDPMRHAGFELQMCIDAVYSAVPIAAGQPSFAYTTSDFRLRYRDDGQMPAAQDAIAADMNPMNPDAPPGAVSSAPPAEAPPPAPGWVATMFAWFDKATGATPPAPPPTAAPYEQPVETELRAFRVAQKTFADRLGRGHFTSVQRLQDHLLVDGRTLPPPLPRAFGAAHRHGYRFELIGTPFEDEWTAGAGRANGPYFEKYVYVAHPEDTSRRTLAIYPDAAIRVAEGRLPVPTDPILLASP